MIKPNRDPIAEIIAYNAPLLSPARRVEPEERAESPSGDLTADALARKLDALARSPFSFFRGTFHLMAADVLRGRVPHAEAAAPEGLIVGDLHLENFGAYRGASGALSFDVNDFDDVGFGPIDFDLKRLCCSALLVDGLPAALRLEAAAALARSWAEGLTRLGGRFPVHPLNADKAEGPVRALLDEHGKKTSAELLAKVAPEKGHKRFGPGGEPPRYVHAAGRWRKIVEAALEEYRQMLEQLKADPLNVSELHDVAYRFKGTGSLGRLRFTALVGHGDERRVIELKESRPSALDEALGRPLTGERARMQAASIRRLQGDIWPLVASTHLGPLSALGRGVDHDEDKLGCEEFAGGGRGGAQGFLSYARQCGEVLARLHVRESAPQLFSAAWDRDRAAAGAVAFAQSYASQVIADHGAFVARRAEVAKGLHLVNAAPVAGA